MATATFPYATLGNISSSSWSLELDSTAGGGSGSGIGRVVEAFDDVHQCLKIIFATVPGEDPFRPTFGCDLTQFLDMPINAALPALVATVSKAIATWEPRITVESISAAPNISQPGQLIASITWKPNLGLINQPNAMIGAQTTTIPVGG